MSQPLGIDDFFALEAGEYLDRLASLSATATAPNADELVRFTRALRGSALMANQQAIARASNGLEHLVRSFRDGRRSWDTSLAGLCREAVDVLRTLVERVRTWTPDDSARAERLALRLEEAAGSAPRPAATPAASETGVRVFLARESAALGSVLDQAGRSLAGGSASLESLQAVLRRMQPLRGLAALADYPPLPDLLDGIERTVTSVSRLELPAKEGGARLDAAAAALARSARDIAEHGRPEADAPEFRRFASLLIAPAPQELPVVPIEALFYAGEEGVVHRGTAPRTIVGAAMSAAAVVSRGEHLCQAADEIAEATADSQRSLRLHLLLADLRTLAAGLPGALEIAVDTFAVSARSAVSRGAAGREPERFVALMREAGGRLRGFTEVTQPGTLASAFEELITSLDMLGATAVDDESDVVPIESLAPDEPEELAPEIVPIEALAPEEQAVTAPEIVPIEALAPDEEPVAAPLAAQAVMASAIAGATERDGWDLAASFSLYEEMMSGGQAAIAAPAEAPEAFIAQPEPVAVAAASAPETVILDIGDLLYHGRSALERADAVRREIRALWSTPESASAVQPLVEELLDLVELAIAD
jgi:chemotaxis protein histidine kinase CheA